MRGRDDNARSPGRFDPVARVFYNTRRAGRGVPREVREVSTGERVTYATLAAGQTEDFRRKFDEAVARLRARIGESHGHRIAGGPAARDPQLFEDRSPADTRVLIGRFPQGTAADVDRAVAAARAAAGAWRARGWRERATILRRAAAAIEERGFALSALVALEAGKNRLEAMGDVTETADLV